MSQLCQLNVAPLHQCCCNCQHHWADYHHCSTKPTLRKKMGNKCACSVQKGWICVGFRFQGDGSKRVHSNWPKHSIGCEMYTPIRKIERSDAARDAEPK